MKSLIACLFGILLVISAMGQPAKAQSSAINPSATKITYQTNTVEIADSVAKKSVVVRKNAIRVQTVGTGVGASATLVDQASGRVIWGGPVARIRIVGIANSDSLKVNSLKTTPFN